METTHASCKPTATSDRPDGSVVHLDEVKARAFLQSLADRPFVSVVVEHGRVRVYTKGMTADAARELLDDVVDDLLADDT